MASKNENNQTCPICLKDDTIRRVSCSNPACAFSFVTCTNCDRDQVVTAFRADHEKDCVHGMGAPGLRATFAAPGVRAA